MKARIEKKLSKKLANECPKLFKGAWQENDCEPTELAENQGSRVSGVMMIGGGVDYWGEGMDAYSCYEWWIDNYYWHGDFEMNPEGHEFEGMPNTNGFKVNGCNLLILARKIELKLK